MAGTVDYNDPSVRIIPSRYLGGTEDVSEWMRNNIADGRTIEVPNGSTVRWAERVIANGISNVTFRGSGTLKAYGVVDRALLELTGNCTNWRFHGVRWDCSQVDQDDTYVPYLTYRNTPLFITGSDNSDIFLRECYIGDIYTDGLFFYQGTGEFVVDGCTFQAEAHRKQQAGQMITVASASGLKPQFTNNKFICAQPVDSEGAFDPAFGFGGILMSDLNGRRGIITGNTFENVGRDNTTAHRVGCIDFYSACSNWDVTGNDILSNWVAVRVSRSQDIDFHHNIVHAYGAPFDGGVLEASSGILTGSTLSYAKRVKFNNNTLVYVGPGSYAASVAIQFSSSHHEAPVFDCEAIGNTVEGFNNVCAMTGSVDNLRVERNISRGCPNGFVRSEYGGAGGDATLRKFNRVIVRGNSFLRSEEGQGCTSGISAALPNPYTGLQTPVTIEGNNIECHDQATSLGVVTFGSDVYLRDNNVDKANIAYYCRGWSTNNIRTKGCYATNVNSLEDYYLAQVTREQPISNAGSLKLDNLAPVAVYSTQRKLMNSYSGPCMEIREDAGDTLEDIGFSLADVTDVIAINDHIDGAGGRIRTFYDQSGNGNHQVQASSAAQLIAATAGAYTQLGGKFLPLGNSLTYMQGGSFSLTDFTFFAVCRFSNSPCGVFNFGAVNVANLSWSGGLVKNYRVSSSASMACPYNQLVQITGYSSDTLRRIWLNGEEGVQDTVSVSATISSAALTYSAFDPTTYRMAGYIGELIIIPGTVSETNRLTIEQNQSEYWGVV